MALALNGGRPVVMERPFTWPPEDRGAAVEIARMLRDGEVSYYGEEGKLAELEKKFERYHGVPYALGTSSGTAALHSAFVALGLQPGDEVIAPTHTFLATVMPIFAANGTPVLADCEHDTECISPEAIRAALTPATKAIVVTHLWGHPASMDAVLAIAREHDLKVVEDCSHAHGSTFRGRPVGTLGDVGCFSLQGKKAVSGGQGGMLLTRDRDLYERALLVGHFRVRSERGIESEDLRRFADTGWGLNYRMHPFAAAMSSSMMDRLDDVIERRRERHTRLTDRLNEIPGIRPPTVRSDVTMGAWYGYKARFVAEQIEGVPLALYVRALQAEGVDVHRPGSLPLHRTALFQGVHRVDRMPFFLQSIRPGRNAPRLFPNAEHVAEVALSLPTFTYEPLSLVDNYADAFEKISEHVEELQALAASDAHG